jgi:hypothetical protein
LGTIWKIDCRDFIFDEHSAVFVNFLVMPVLRRMAVFHEGELIQRGSRDTQKTILD